MARGIRYYAMGRFDEALTDLDKANSLGDRTPQLYGIRGCCYLRDGRYQKGRKSLRKAIRLNPQDVGKGYRPSTKKRLSPEAVAHGDEQVREMLADRPPMKQCVTEGDVLWRWAARKFAGEDLDDTVDWDPTPPVGAKAEHIPPCKSQRGKIRVAEQHCDGPEKGQPLSSEELWSCAVFELHNIANAAEFDKVTETAKAGIFEKPAYVFRMYELEHLALQRTRAFYVHVYLPHVIDRGLDTEPAHWDADSWESARQVFDQCTDRSRYPWLPYGRYYDWIMAQHCVGKKEYAEARRLLESVVERQIRPWRKAMTYHWIGHCHAAEGDFAAAEKAYSQAIHFDAANADHYVGRASVRSHVGDLEGAQDDIEAALRRDQTNKHATLLRTWVLYEQARRAAGDGRPSPAWEGSLHEAAPDAKRRSIEDLDERRIMASTSFWTSTGSIPRLSDRRTGTREAGCPRPESRTTTARSS
jgi:tetratricopeptide (TPR) repeat protein